MSSEIERFAKKAEGYRAALSKVPNARILETTYILGIVDGFIKNNHLERREVVVLDLMAGSGFLSNALYDAGYRNLHAIEVCNEMSQDAKIYEEKVRLHRVSSIFDIRTKIQDFKPLVIVSLASFHHLIVEKADGTIDREASIINQDRLYNICRGNLSRGGLILIADIFEDTIHEIPNPGTSLWRPSKKTIKMIPKNSLLWLRKLVKKVESLHQLTEELNDITGMNEHSNPALTWFRSIVDKQTTIGHDDVALSKKFIERINHNETIGIDVISCPWLFQTDYELKNFILKKFGFSLDEDSQRPSDDEIFNQANSILGIEQKEGTSLLNWRLAIVSQVLSIDDEIRPYRLSTIWLLAISDFIIAILIVLKLKWMIDINADIGNWTLYVLFSILGILIGRFVGWIGRQNR